MRIVKIINMVMAAVIAVFFVLTVVPGMLGIKYFAVLSGSMKPTIQVGAEVYADTEDHDIHIGDIIVFTVAGQHVTHRVIGTNQYGEYITKGDNSPAKDSNPVQPENVVGKVIGSIPGFGYVLTIIMRYKIPVCGFILMIWVSSNIIPMYIRPKNKKSKHRTSEKMKL